jgi:hypothetical protein
MMMNMQMIINVAFATAVLLLHLSTRPSVRLLFVTAASAAATCSTTKDCDDET